MTGSTNSIPAKAATAFGACAILSVATTASFAAPETCADFQMKRNDELRKVHVIDHSPEGVSVGDQRIGYFTLQDETSANVGEVRWIATIVEIDENSGETKTSSVGFIILPGGVIHVARPPETTMSSAHSETERNTTGDHIIVGGSGIFANASGTMSRIENHTHDFKVTCD